MDVDFLNYTLAFIEGFALILSPCILPILPVLLSGSIEGGKARPWGIISGFVLTFALFTLFSRALVQYYSLDVEHVRTIAFILIGLFGLILISNKWSEKFSLATHNIADFGNRLSQHTEYPGFGSGLILGSLISLIWVPCGGPILAAAIVQTAIQKTSWHSFLTFLFFALGSAIPMILLSLAGRKIIDYFPFLKTQSEFIRKFFGVIIVVGALAAAFYTPGSGFTPLPLAPNVVTTDSIPRSEGLIGALNYPYPAPALNNYGTWLNSIPLNLNDLKGKVILIDFWTYSCINCVRTFPYLKNWYNQFKDKNFLIIGVHAPEFEFEKNINNVEAAVKKYALNYPIVLDNNYVIWSNYNNRYWPAQYLINKEGFVVYQHFGEGNEAITQHNIEVLLGLKRDSALINEDKHTSYLQNQTPETYLGYARGGLENSLKGITDDSNFDYPAELKLNAWALQGKWKISSQRIISLKKGASIKIHFNASKVYVVAGSINGQTITVDLRLNKKKLHANQSGEDVYNGKLIVERNMLYQVIKLDTPQEGILELKADSKGLELYTFTFG